MTLKEKFKMVLKNAKIHFINLDSQECEQIADEYAIEFAVWLNINYFQIVGKKLWSKDLCYDFCYTAKELLEIFKKEKGL